MYKPNPDKQAATQGLGFAREHPLRLATSYVPPQQMIRQTFSLSDALQKGTLFPELYSPYQRREAPRHEF